MKYNFPLKRQPSNGAESKDFIGMDKNFEIKRNPNASFLSYTRSINYAYQLEGSDPTSERFPLCQVLLDVESVGKQ